MSTPKKINRNLAAIFGLSATLLSVSVLAEEYNPSWYITPSLHAADIDDGFGPGSTSYGAGLGIGKPITDNIDIQLGTTYTQSKNSYQRFYQNAYKLDALYLFSRETFRPFIVFGVGAERDRMNSSLGLADRYSPNASLGVGFQYVLSDQFSVQADWRKVHGYLRGADFGFKQASNNFLSFALVYAFEKSPSRAPVAIEAAPAPQAPIINTPPVIVVPVAPPPPARFEKITLSATELFAFNSSHLADSQQKLDGIADALNSNTQIDNVVITGYTDRIGTKKYNQKLSEERANAVKAYLEGKGVSSSRMNAIGKGESNPVVQCNEKSKAKLINCLEPNRRVEVDQITIEKRVQ